ncbi:alanine racemase [Paraburkholderia sp. RL18-101-BIB-B]|uniref:alanine racemase n=1 Tax=unclassified Paraburkholderia TaxID=2615204 RepID=UPI0038BE15F7
MFDLSSTALKRAPSWAASLPEELQTPCFIVSERGIVDNLHATARACGGVERLMPHVKTHRAGWIVKRLIREGVTAFKTATVAEVAMVLEAGAKHVVWAYPTVNPAHIRTVLALAHAHPDARVEALVDSAAGVAAWRLATNGVQLPNLSLLIDLDAGMGRTGAPIATATLQLARELATLGCFGGWHVYDGHIHDLDNATRRKRVAAIVEEVTALARAAEAEGLSRRLIAGGSYTFDLWPLTLADFVSPGSWAYSSAQHDLELPALGWTPSAYVLATVISRNSTTATLDAGSKAISPDKPLAERFRWDGKIVMMSEEHVVVENTDLAVGDRVMLLPRHACTTAYLYPSAIVLTAEGSWEVREQLGNRR